MQERFQQLLSAKKPAILEQWFEAVAATYPADTASFLKGHKAPFTNPVGSNLAEGLAGLFEGLLKGVMPGETAAFLDGIVRIRAVQDFAASEAVSFVFQLKKIVRGTVARELAAGGLADDLAAFDGTVDDLALFAFDLYMQCREKIYEIKANEARAATFRLLQRANQIAGDEK